MDKTSQWLHVQLVDAIQRGDAVEVARAAIVLGSGAGMAFGMVIGAIDSREVLYGEALDALTAMIDRLPDNQCEPVLAAIRAGNLEDVKGLRAKLADAIAARHQNTLARARAAIAAATPQALAAALNRTFGSQALGVEMPTDQASRAMLHAEARARLASLLPDVPDDEAIPILAHVRRFGIQIDVAARAEAITARRSAMAVAAIAPEPRNEALEPEWGDDSAWAVYGDWLQAQGHPRGELIALDLAGADTGAFIDAHVDALLGPLAAHRVRHDGSNEPAFVWRRGFIESALLSNDDNGDASLDRVADILDLLLVHPSGRRLRSLAIGLNGFPDATLDDVVRVLARRRPKLGTLALGEFTHDQCELSWYTAGDLSPLWPALTLRALRVHAGAFELGDLVLPELESVAFETGGLTPSNAASIAAATWPKLAALDVWFGDPNYGGDCTITDARRIVQSLPRVARLALKNCAFADELGPLLRDRPLDTLDLSLGTLSDDGVPALLGLKVNTLDVSQTYVSPEGVARLRASLPVVIANHMRVDPPEDRMVCVGE